MLPGPDFLHPGFQTFELSGMFNLVMLAGVGLSIVRKLLNSFELLWFLNVRGALLQISYPFESLSLLSELLTLD